MMVILESGRDTTRAGRPGRHVQVGGVCRGYVHILAEVTSSARRDTVGVASDKSTSLALAGAA